MQSCSTILRLIGLQAKSRANSRIVIWISLLPGCAVPPVPTTTAAALRLRQPCKQQPAAYANHASIYCCIAMMPAAYRGRTSAFHEDGWMQPWIESVTCATYSSIAGQGSEAIQPNGILVNPGSVSFHFLFSAT